MVANNTIQTEEQKLQVVEEIRELSSKLNERDEVLKKLNNDLREAEEEMQTTLNELKARIASLKENIKTHSATDSGERKRISQLIADLKTKIADYEVQKILGA